MFKFLEEITPDLILLSADMPETDGFEAMAILKSDEKFNSIPVIFLSETHDAETEIRCFETGALDFIKKPFCASVLIKRIETRIETDRLIKTSRQAVLDIHNAAVGIIKDLVENWNKVSGGHIERTQSYNEILVKALVRVCVFESEMRQKPITVR